MPMPIAAMNEDDLAPLSEDDIRTPGQLLTMKPIAITQTMQHRSDQEFRLCISASDARHVLRASFRCQSISHLYSDAITLFVRQRVIAGSRCCSKNFSNEMTLP